MDWINAELPFDVPTACVVRAAEHYSIPKELLVAMLKVENGEVGKVYPRSHGTYYGPSQVSDKWLPVFEPWGLTAHMLQHNACANVAAGAYVLAYYKVREPDLTRAIARYNVGSLNTPAQVDAGFRYARKVLGHWTRIYEKWGSPANAAK